MPLPAAPRAPHSPCRPCHLTLSPSTAARAGYLQAREGTKLSLPAGVTGGTLVVTPNFAPDSPEPVKFPVAIDPAYGSLHANFTVPKAARQLQYEVALRLGSPEGGEHPGGGGDGGPFGAAVAAEAFQVADPRPPTAVLNLTAPDWVRAARARRRCACLLDWKPGARAACSARSLAARAAATLAAHHSPLPRPLVCRQALPDATVRALITVTSYIGADVAGARVRVSWTAPLASGALNVTTDARVRAPRAPHRASCRARRCAAPADFAAHHVTLPCPPHTPAGPRGCSYPSGGAAQGQRHKAGGHPGGALHVFTCSCGEVAVWCALAARALRTACKPRAPPAHACTPPYTRTATRRRAGPG